MLDPATIFVVSAAVWKAIDGNKLAQSAFESAVSTIWGNRAEWAFGHVRQGIINRLKDGQIVNHDIQRAVHEAYLNATQLACRACLEPLERSRSFFGTNDSYFSDEAKSLRKISRYLDDELEKFRDENYVPASALAIQGQIGVLMVPEPVDDTGPPSSQPLRDQLLAEISGLFGNDTGQTLPDSFQKSILDGWQDGKGKQDWFEWVCGFFHEYLKTRPRLSEILEKQWLAELKISNHAISIQVDKVQQSVADMSGQVVELITLIKQLDGKTDELLEYGRLIPIILELLRGKLQPQTPARAKYLNTFAHYDLANLVGREDQFEEIEKHFTHHRLLLLRGMGGIGKTTLARAYMARCDAQYDHVAFVEIPNGVTIADTLLNTLGVSPDLTFTRDTKLNTEANFAKLLDVLRHIPNTLLVVDNANDGDDLLLRKPAFDSLPGKVLITSRNRVGAYQQAQNELEIKRLMPDEAKALFVKLYRMKLNEAESHLLDNILEKAFYHPKLIEVLAKAIRENPLLDLMTLRDIVADKDYKIDYPVEIGNEEKPVYRILLDLFNTDPLDDDLKQLLRYFSVLPTIDIPFSHLTELLNIAEPKAKKKLIGELKKLTRSGWLDDLDNRFFSMHGLVQWVVQEQLKPTLDNCHDLINGANVLLFDLFTQNPLSTQSYLVYGDELIRFFEEDENGPLTTLYSNIAGSYGALGDNQKGLEYNLKALAIREQTLSPTHPDLAMSYANIAVSYGALGDNQKGLEYDLKALAIREQTLSPTHPDLAGSYNNIAVTYYYVGELDRALQYMQQAVAIREQVLPPEHPDLISSRESLAFLEQAVQERNKNSG